MPVVLRFPVRTYLSLFEFAFCPELRSLPVRIPIGRPNRAGEQTFKIEELRSVFGMRYHVA